MVRSLADRTFQPRQMQQMTPEQMQQMQQMHQMQQGQQMGNFSQAAMQQMQQMQIPMPTGATSWEERTISNEPDPSKMIYTGKVRKNTGENGFLSCPETYATYQRDVYMWKSYCQQCVVGDYVKFQLHISEKGLPQVCCYALLNSLKERLDVLLQTYVLENVFEQK